MSTRRIRQFGRRRRQWEFRGNGLWRSSRWSMRSTPAGNKSGKPHKPREKNDKRLLEMPAALRDSAFINIPYDAAYKDHFLAYIAGVATFGLNPRATLELTSGERRLDRIFNLISVCKYSFHDLSFVRLDRKLPATPRFNMPFELGLVVGWQNASPSGHQWFVFESTSHRLQKSLSDLNGTDPFIYGWSAEGILREIRNALVRHDIQPSAGQMQGIFAELRDEVSDRIVEETGASSMFEARAFTELVVSARRLAEAWIPGLREL